MKIRKRKLIDDEDNEEEEKPQKVLMSIGDITLQVSKGNLRQCKRMCEEVIRSETIKDYLTFFQKKKITLPSGIS